MRIYHLLKLIISCIAIISCAFHVSAQSHGKEQIMTSLRGAKISSGTSLSVTDPKFLAWTGTAADYIDNSDYQLIESDVVVRLKHEEDIVAVTEEAFTLEIIYQLSYSYNDGSQGSIVTKRMNINYDPSENSVYTSEKLERIVSTQDKRIVSATISISSVTITSPSRVEPPAEVHLDLIIDQTRIYDMTVQSAPDMVLPASATGSWIDVSWTAIEGAESYDLEWVFVETLGTLYDFKKANRINVKNNKAKISKLLPAGTAVFRVRGVGLNPGKFATGKEVRQTTAWSTSSNSGSLASAADAIAFSAFASSLNWTAETSFAEDGKSIESVTFVDGLGKTRQSLTSFRADGNVVVSENIYDLDGRESVKMMPVPMEGLDMAFKKNNNKFLYGDFGFLDFSKTAMLNPDSSVYPNPMPSNSAYSNYYSSNNPMTFEGRDLVPHAGGYAYTQQSYTKDGTDQVKYVSSPGDGFHLGQRTNHYMRYSYAKPLQGELNRLFGTEVGDKQHYSKNMITDQNGQITVQYLDNKGRLIASAYAGTPPPSLVHLDNKAMPDTIVDNITKGSYPSAPYDEVSMAYDIAVASNSFMVDYSLTTSVYGNTCLSVPDREIPYNVLIEVYNEEGNLLANARASTGTSVISIANYQSGDPIGFVPVGSTSNTGATTSIDSINITGLIPGSSYKIVRRLAVDLVAYNAAMDEVEQTLQNQLDAYVTAQQNGTPLPQGNCLDFDYEATITCLEGCDAICEASLQFVDENGTTHYIYSYGNEASGTSNLINGLSGSNTPPELSSGVLTTTDINSAEFGLYEALLLECKAECEGQDQSDVAQIAESKCESQYRLLVEDMSPGGQYFDNTPYQYELDPLTLKPQFDVNGERIEVANYSTTVINSWLIANIGATPIISGAPWTATTWTELRTNWDDSYGDFLATYHPEYAWYNFQCEMASVTIKGCIEKRGDPQPDIVLNLASSRAFDKILRTYTNNCDVEGISITLPGNNTITDANLFFPLGTYNVIPTTASIGYPSSGTGLADRYMTIPVTSSCSGFNPNNNNTVLDPLVPSADLNQSVFMTFMRSRLLESLKMSGATNNYSASIYYLLFNPESIALPSAPSIYANPSNQTNLEAFQQTLAGYQNVLGSQSEYEVFREQYLYWKNLYLKYIFVKYVAPDLNPQPTPAPSTLLQTKNFVWANDKNYNSFYGEYLDLDNDGVANDPDDLEMNRYRLLYTYDPSEELIIEEFEAIDNAILDAEFDGCFNPSYHAPLTISENEAMAIVTKQQNLTYKSNCEVFADQWLEEIVNDGGCFNDHSLTGIDLENYKRAIRFKLIEICAAGSYVGVYWDTAALSGAGDTSFVNNIYGHSDPNNAPWNASTNPNNPYAQGPYADIPFSTTFTYQIPGGSLLNYTIDNVNELYDNLKTNGCNTSSIAEHNGAEVTQQELALFDPTDQGAGCMCDNMLDGINGGSDNYVWSDPNNTVNSLEHNVGIVTTYLNTASFGLGADNAYATRVINYCGNLAPENLADVDGTATIIFPQTLECESCKCNNLFDLLENYSATLASSFDENDADWNWSNVSAADRTTIVTELNQSLGLAVGSSDYISVTDIGNWISKCNNATDLDEFTRFPEILRCLENKVEIVEPCSTSVNEADMANAIALYEQNAADFLAEEREKYMQLAWDSIENREYLKVSYGMDEYYYTLYVYDQADNLVKTVPPNGVVPIQLTESLDMSGAVVGTYGSFNINELPTANYSATNEVDDVINTLRDDHENMRILPKHTMETRYLYNSMNQVYQQQTPDGGITQFWYNDLEQLVVSQNAEQRLNEKYSYTIYDNLNRPFETGVISNVPLMDNPTARTHVDYYAWLGTVGAIRTEVTRTHYDNAPTYVSQITAFSPENLRNRVAAVMYYDTYVPGSEAGYATAYHYSYDVHGNVNDLVSEDRYAPTDLQFKRVQYEYDILSGNVNKVSYQPDQTAEEFYHRYSYDDNNRLVKVETSHDDQSWAVEARYFYYPHGPLRRVEIGNKHVQAQDYAYTLQGWIKGVNSAVAQPKYDIGSDGYIASLHPNNRFGADAGGYTLGYYDEGTTGLKDYLAIGGNAAVQFDMQDYINGSTSDLTHVTHVNNTFNVVGSGSAAAYAPLYNGNISRMTTANRNIMQDRMGTTVTAYRYDQANRIKGVKDVNLLEADPSVDAFATANSFATGIDDYLTSNGGAITALSDNYEVAYAYDQNGNIQGMLRQGNEVTGSSDMDSLNYAYAGNTNRLTSVSDIVTNTNHAGAIKPGTVNYTYDALGNLTGETHPNSADDVSIEWTAAGKVKQVNTSSDVIKFYYDPMGNRIAKEVIPSSGNSRYTRYSRDASGNTMATSTVELSKPQQIADGASIDTDWEIYGSSRLGTQTEKYTAEGQQYGNKRYEFSNHLGNVLHTHTDHLMQGFEQVSAFELIPQNPFTLSYEYPSNLVTETNNGGLKLNYNSVSTPNGSAGPPISKHTYSFSVQQGERYRIELDYILANSGFLGGIEQFDIEVTQGQNVLATTVAGSPTLSQLIQATANPSGNNGTKSLEFFAGSTGQVTLTVIIRPKFSVLFSGSVDGPIAAYTAFPSAITLTNFRILKGGYLADIQNASMYYPFGSLQPGRNGTSSNAYRYGFNGHEKDDEIKGRGNHLSFGDQGYDPILGRRWNQDPVVKEWESPYATFRNNPLIYADPDGNDGILIVFPDYKVDPELEVTAWGENFKAPKLPLGHAGVLLIDNETGLTKYYEFGRYPTSDGTKGKVRNIKVPNVVIDPETGKPTQESLNKVLGVISDKAGHKGRIQGAYVEGDFKVMNDYAQEKLKESNPQYKEYDKERAPYDLYDNNCGTFGCDVLKQDEGAADEAPWIFNPTPDNVAEEYQDNFPKVDYDPKTKTTTSDIYKKKE